MASIQRIKSELTGAISYRVQVRVKGRPAQSETFPNKREAERWAQSVESAVREQRHFPSEVARRTPFSDLVKRYETAVLAGLKEAAKKKRAQQLTWWKDKLSDARLVDVTPARVAEVRDALAAEGRGPATCNRYLAALSHCFTMAVKEWQLIERNPVRDVSKKKEPRGRTRFLSDDERESLIKSCSKSDWKPLHTLVLMALTTGARRGELCGLKWSDVDLHIKKEKKTIGQALVTETKNGEQRMLPIVGQALDAMRELKLHGSNKCHWVFAHPNGLDEPLYHFDLYWNEALKDAKIENFRFHDLRHSCASYLAAGGASLLEIADTLGHKSLAMVKRYSHLAQQHKVAVIEKMAKEKAL